MWELLNLTLTLTEEINKHRASEFARSRTCNGADASYLALRVTSRHFYPGFFTAEQDLVGISAVMLVVFYRRLGIRMNCHIMTVM